MEKQNSYKAVVACAGCLHCQRLFHHLHFIQDPRVHVSDQLTLEPGIFAFNMWHNMEVLEGWVQETRNPVQCLN